MGQERRGEKAGGRLVTGRETKEGAEACVRSRGVRGRRFVLDAFTIGSTGNIEAIAGDGGSCFATVMAGDIHRRRDGEDAGSGLEFRSRFDDMPGGARGLGVNG